MDNFSEGWYKKIAISLEDKQRISAMCEGEIVDELKFGGVERKLLKVNADVFARVFIANRKFLLRGDYTAPPDENDYINATNYLTEDGLAGFAITDDGWLVSLFSNYEYRGFAKSITSYVQKAYKLVCIVADTDENNGLIDVYHSLFGFTKYVRTCNDTNIMREYYGDEFIDNFVKMRGKPFHIFMIGKNAVGEGENGRVFEDYFEAEQYVNDTVHNRDI